MSAGTTMVLLALFAAAMLAVAGDVWSGGPTRRGHLERHLHMDEASQMGMVRTFPFVAGACAVFALALPLASVETLKPLAAALFVIDAALFVPVQVAITLFDRPRFLIPPPYRYYRGKGTAWLERRREHRSGKHAR